MSFRKIMEKYEAGFKDTLHCPAYFITRIIVDMHLIILWKMLALEKILFLNTSEGLVYYQLSNFRTK